MSIFANRGIILDQLKEPALSRDLKGFYYADSTDIQMDRPPFDNSHPIDSQTITDIALAAGIIDEHDGKPLFKKLTRARRLGAKIVAADAIDDQPYLSSQLGPLLRLPEDAVGGLRLAAKAIGASKMYIAVYKNLHDLKTKIPNSLEGVHIKRITGKYPAGSRFESKFDGERKVAMIGTCALIHLYRAVYRNIKQTTCFVTVAGNCVANPHNVEVSIGMPVRRVLDKYGLIDEPGKIIVGGSMTGRCVTDASSMKVDTMTRAILAFKTDKKDRSYNCIGCGRCVEVCVQWLSPYLLYKNTVKMRKKQLFDLGAMSCIECGTCSYICPAHLELSFVIGQGKRMLGGKTENEDTI